MIRFFVEGIPRTKGSLKPWHKWAPRGADGKSHCTFGLSEQTGANLAIWRSAVRRKAKLAVEGHKPLGGPIRVDLEFYFARYAVDKLRPEHSKQPWVWGKEERDIDKLSRAVLDALTEAGVYVDDSHVADLHAKKLYMTAGQPAGVYVEVEPLG